ncbi:hypothetical protein J437_LFUL005087 [Ladona fulva]|uniref:GRIP domain-containing protein n=1 Tax=Ladona fulva TaxID=123851 RepID=A0A8K0JX42_LADFU|nr:hypothetical protein J437_LFUL005087 [Ladona fulva]
MAWLGEGLSSLRGQITSFTKEVLSEGREENYDQEGKLREAQEKIQELENLCSAKDKEISRLNEVNNTLELKANQLFENQKQHQQSSLFNVGSTSSLGEISRVYSLEDLGYGKKETTYDFSSMETEKDDLVEYLRAEIRALKIEKEKFEKKLRIFENESKSSGQSLGASKPEVDQNRANTSDNSSANGQHAGSTVLKKDSLVLDQDSAMEVSVGDLDLRNHDVEMINAVQLGIISPSDQNQQNCNDKGHLSYSEKISEGLKSDDNIDAAVRRWRIEDARGECDGSEEMPKEVSKLMAQIQKLTSSLSDAQLSLNQSQGREKQLLHQIEKMKEQELKAEVTISNLNIQLESIQYTNEQLEQKLEDLDRQHMQALDQLMSVKSSLQQKNEDLQSVIKEMDQKILNLEKEISVYSSNANAFNQNESSLRREIELEIEKKILKFVPPELIPRESSSSGDFVVIVGAVKGLAKMCEEHRWKKEAMEKKMAEIVKEARETESQYLQLRADIAHREKASGLRTEGLEPILETGEEEEEDEDEPDAPRTSVENRSFKPNMETKMSGSSGDNINLQRRCLALEEEIKKLRAKEVVEPDFDEEDEDDVEGIEEANDWTWQANLEPKKADVSTDSGSSAEVTNQVKDSVFSQSDVLSLLINDEKLIDQFSMENSKLEKVIEELQAEKQSLETEREASFVAIEKIKEEVDDLKEDLEIKDKHVSHLKNDIKLLKEKLSTAAKEKDLLEQQIAQKDEEIKELALNVTSLGTDFESEKRKNDEMRKTIFDLNSQIAQQEFILKDKEELLHKHQENEKFLEEENVSLQHSIKREEDTTAEHLKYVSELEDVINKMKSELTKEIELKDIALKDAQTFSERCQDLENKLKTEIQGKEEVLIKFSEVEGRFKLLEESIDSDMISKNEFALKVNELESRFKLIQEEAALDRKLKDDAILKTSEQNSLLAHMENELEALKAALRDKETEVKECQQKVFDLEMERERIMCVVGDKAREISSLRLERQRLMEAMSSLEMSRQKEVVESEQVTVTNVSSDAEKHRDATDQTDAQPGEREELDDDGTIQLLAKLKSLQLESEQLAESYRHEQQRNKHLQNEIHEMMEKEASLQDELSRLREHLVAVEDRYTKEAINAQERIAFLKNKLTQVEERLHASSSAYTSASVRCNQQVESLENQVRALTEKRDESKNRLLAAEEQLAQQAKDLANLQSVLEQFQRDKERETSVIKDKMGMEISSLENKCKELFEEISELRDQLQKAREGLCAASHLSEEMDKKSEIITFLKDELQKVNANLKSAEEKLLAASQNVEGKVDKNLVKNLLLGYLSAPSQGSRRGEVLRIIAMILEFNQEEKERVDLGDGSGKGLAFIRFLENESRPKSQIRMLSDARVESNRSSPSSLHSSASATSSPSLLLSEAILPTLPTFSVASGSNSSCILKDVLKDS